MAEIIQGKFRKEKLGDPIPFDINGAWWMVMVMERGIWCAHSIFQTYKEANERGKELNRPYQIMEG